MFLARRNILTLSCALFMSYQAQAAITNVTEANFDGINDSTNPATAVILNSSGTTGATWSNVTKTTGGSLVSKAFTGDASNEFLWLDSGGKNANFNATATLELNTPQAVDSTLVMEFDSFLSRRNSSGNGYVYVEGFGGATGTDRLFKLRFNSSASQTQQIFTFNSSDTAQATGGSIKYNTSAAIADSSDFASFYLRLHPTNFDLSMTNLVGADVSLTGLDYNTTTPATTLSKIVFTVVTGASGKNISGARFDNINVGVDDSPTALPASNTSGSSFTANWNSQSGADSYNLEYADNAAFTGSAVETGIIGTSFVVNKSSNVTYYYRVAAVDGGVTSSYSAPITVSTYLLGAGLTESFDNGIPTDWPVLNLSGDDAWISGAPATSSYRPTNTDGKYVSCTYDRPNNDWLITHKVAIPPAKGAKLSFKAYHGYRTGSTGSASQRKFKVKVAVDTGSNQLTTGDYNDVFSFDGIHPDQNFQDFDVDISDNAYKGKDIYIAFVYDGSNGRALSLDDVKLTEITTTEITGYDAIADLALRNSDTAVDELAEVQALLPSTVTIAGTFDTRAVTWTTDSSPNYDNSSNGTYIFTATLGAIPEGYTDNTAETVTANVIVTESFGVEILTPADSIESTPNLTGSAFSMTGWIKVDSTGQRGCFATIGEDDVDTGNNPFGFWVNPNGANAGRIEFWNGAYKGSANGLFPIDQWVQFAITGSTTSSNKIYINGALVWDTEVNQNAATNAILELGSTLANNPAESGSKLAYDEIAVFSKELTAQEVSEIYDGGTGHELDSSFNSMELYWRFEDEPQASTVADTDDDNDSAGTISGSQGTSYRWVAGVTVGSVITPAIGLQVSQTGNELVWTVEDEIGVKGYQIFVDGELFDTVQAVDADFYSLKIPADAKVKLVVVDDSGHEQTYLPEDGNVKIQVYDLEEGWNLIAVTSDDADLETLKDETVGVLWGWNGSGYEVVETASATEAVWVYSPIAKQVHVSGTKSDAKISLNLGWNMVGPVENDYIPAKADTVYAWSEIYDEIAGEDKVLMGGKGYWIFSL